jgi:hypothetical protein
MRKLAGLFLKRRFTWVLECLDLVWRRESEDDGGDDGRDWIRHRRREVMGRRIVRGMVIMMMIELVLGWLGGDAMVK